MFPGNFGQMPPPNYGGGDDDDGEEGGDEAAMQAAAAAMMGGQQPANMNDLLQMLGGAQRAGPGAAAVAEDDEEDEEDVDETFSERLVGLTEMFPDRVRKVMATLVGGTLGAVKWTWVNGQSFAWAVTATCMIAVMPIVIERERHQFQQEQLAQQRQMLLGPGAAAGAAGHSTYAGLMPAAGLK